MARGVTGWLRAHMAGRLALTARGPGGLSFRVLPARGPSGGLPPGSSQEAEPRGADEAPVFALYKPAGMVNSELGRILVLLVNSKLTVR